VKPASVRVRWLVGLLILVGCGGTTAVRPRNPTYLKAIRVDGNRAIADDALVPGLQLDRTRRGGRAVDPYQLALDTDRIRAAYLKKGFFAVAVQARIDGPEGGAAGAQTVVFTVVEGPRATVQVVIEGLPPEVALADARARVPLADGAAFDYEVYDLAKQALLDLVEDAGYAHVDIDPEVTTDKRGVAIARYRLIPGPRCRFGPIVIRGVEGDLRRAIIGRLEIATGQPYSLSRLKASQAAIYQLGRFSSVRIVPERDVQSVVVPVSILVTRSGRGELKLGAGGGYDPIAPEVRVRAGISHVPDALPLWTFGVDSRIALVFREVVETQARTYEPRVRVLASAQRIELFKPRVSADVGLGYDYFTLEAYTAQGPFAQLGVGTSLFVPWLSLRAGWSLTNWSFSDISDALDATAQQRYGLDRDGRVGLYQQTLTLEKRDNPTSPRWGGYLALRVAEGTQLAGGEYDYLQLTPDLRGYLPLGPVVLALRGRVGLFFGEVPVTERVFGGGAQSHRGFAYRQLAPSVTREVDGKQVTALIGGTALVETSVELRARVGTLSEFPIVASVFLDGADVVEDRGQLGERMLHLAAGIGGGIDLDGIKVRLDLGYRLNRTGPDEPAYDAGFRWPTYHIGIGDAF